MGYNGKGFKLIFKEAWLKVDDIISTDNNIQLKVTRAPRRRWYHLLLQYITFGLFRATRYYIVKRI